MSELKKKMPSSFNVARAAHGYKTEEIYVFGSAKALEAFAQSEPNGDEFHLIVKTSYMTNCLLNFQEHPDKKAWEQRIKDLTGVGE